MINYSKTYINREKGGEKTQNCIKKTNYEFSTYANYKIR